MVQNTHGGQRYFVFHLWKILGHPRLGASNFFTWLPSIICFDFPDFCPDPDFFEEIGPEMVRIDTNKSGLDKKWKKKQ